MVNIAKLKGKIAESGMNRETLSEVSGICQSSLSRKMNGKSAFTVDEAAVLCKVLQITDYGERASIFLP